MQLTVVQKVPIAADTVRLRLTAKDRYGLPPFRPGAHIELAIQGLSRRYSITSSHKDLGFYEICVLRTNPSRGGSSFIHDTLAIGDEVKVSGPFNAFSLAQTTAHSVFIAGGIGITPFFSMMEELTAAGQSLELHYSGRDAGRLLPIPAIQGQVTRYVDGSNGPTLIVRDLLDGLRPESHLYVCGPQAMIEAVREGAQARGWPSNQVHFESFGSGLKSTDRAVTLHLQRSGLTLSVLPGTSILDALLENGVWASHECRRGECGSCLTDVLAGEPSHRDVCLTDEQRRTGMCTCVSWSNSPELILDL
jgi:vanillate O-demethylase ferredoxin subunit